MSVTEIYAWGKIHQQYLKRSPKKIERSHGCWPTEPTHASKRHEQKYSMIGDGYYIVNQDLEVISRITELVTVWHEDPEKCNIHIIRQ